jgi:hypothetical protein
MSQKDAAPATRRSQARVPSVPRSGWSCSEALGEGIAAGERAVRARDLPTPRATELLPEHVRVGLGGSRRDAEPSCDLLVRVSGGDELDHLELPIRDRRRSLVQHCDHAATLPTRFVRAYWPDGVSCDLRLRAYAGALGMDEARLVPAAVCLGQLVLVEGADPLQQVELVA